MGFRRGPAVRPGRRSPGSGRALSHARGGFTLAETAIATLILVVAVGGLTGSILAGMKLSRTNSEQARAEAEARAMLARIEGTAFAAVFATFNADPADDPGGAGTAHGSGFDVTGMTAPEGDPDGLVGEILFPIDAVPGVLREDVTDPAFNMPRDLNGDGNVDALDHSDDYVVLPVRVRLSWTGASGPRSLERSVILVQ